MNIKKQILATLEKVYSVGAMELFGEKRLFAATEAEGRCLMFSPPDWKVSEVWDKPGGTMNIVPLGGGYNGILAIQKFLPVFKSENACIVHAEPGRNMHLPWIVEKIADLPYVHRIEAIEISGRIFVIASTLCGAKAFQDDWSIPGAVYIMEFGSGHTINQILGGLTKNHGMIYSDIEGQKVVLVSASEGVYRIDVPTGQTGQWVCTQMIDNEVSDIAVVDIDSDGDLEIVTIEPFHGDSLVIYKKIHGSWVPVFKKDINFGHALWAGMLLNKPGIIVGNRGGKKDLVLFRPVAHKTLEFDSVTLDEGVGPAQICVVHEDGSDMILAANHAFGQVALYKIEE